MKSKERVHFIGVGGVGMSGLARLLLKRDVAVSGSDASSSYITEKLLQEGISVVIGHGEEYVSEGMTVVYTTGIDEKNPEYAAALKLRCPLLHRSDMLCQLMEGYQVLAVAGSHGKTTTSALLASVLTHAGIDPAFAVGGTLCEYQSNSRHGTGPYFVAEACESDGTFVKYRPYGAILTNIDLDHMNFFFTEDALMASFKTFAAGVANIGHLFWCGDDSRLCTMALPGYSYGFGERCGLRIMNVRQEGWSQLFDFAFQGKVYESVALPLIGKHSVLNAAAVFGLCLTLGVSEEEVRRGLAAFQGVGRRCEKKEGRREVLIVDDYAHHPTEITTTLWGIRNAIDERRLIAVFQPHRYTRTRDCLGLFAEAFDAADEVVVTDIYSAGEDNIEGVSAQKIVEEVTANYRVHAHYVPRSLLTEYIAETSRPHDVIVTMGAGDITKVGKQLLTRWESSPPRKWRVGVIYGGRSMEHEVSLLSAANVIDSLDEELYEIELFGIEKSGRWQKRYVLEPLSEGHDKNGTLTPEVLSELQRCEVFFPILHGPYGEDGTLQGFFDTLGKPYIGCDHRSAAFCMDKALTKKIAALCGVPVVPFLSFSEYEWRKDRGSLQCRVMKELRYPVFVKPLHLGSTVGISKVEKAEDLEAAIEAAFRVDTHLLIENGLKVREIEFAVLGNDVAKTFPPGEILTGGRVYDYKGKYDYDDPIKTTAEAKLSDGIIELGMAWAKKAYLAAECKGMARVDFFLDEEGQLWLNEINPIPGFTKLSLYPQICAVNGLPGNKLVDRLIVLALQRKRQLVRSLENL